MGTILSALKNVDLQPYIDRNRFDVPPVRRSTTDCLLSFLFFPAFGLAMQATISWKIFKFDGMKKFRGLIF